MQNLQETLFQEIQMHIRAIAIESTRRAIHDKEFQNKHKVSSKDFSRNRKLTFVNMVSMILRLVKNSLQIECNLFGDLMDIDPASKQAFSQARSKLRPEAFEELWGNGIRVFYTHEGNKGLWKGYRLVAGDGSTLRLPNSQDLAMEFGRYPSLGNDGPVMARISEYTDVTTKLVLSGRIAPYAVSEAKLAEEQLEEVVPRLRSLGQSKLLFVYDRGYPSTQFITQHVRLGVDFVFRLPKDFNKATSEISKWEDREGFIAREGWPILRLVKIPLSSGETELLLTTLTDKVDTFQDLSEVYEGRWTSMEEGYKRQKITMELENFSGKTALAIRQEYWATLVVANLLEMGCIDIEGCWVPGNLPAKHVNRSVLFGSMRDATMKVILGLIPLEEYERQADEIAKRSMLKRRPGRRYSRAGVGKPKHHHVYRRVC
jgi:hypothetical protein